VVGLQPGRVVSATVNALDEDEAGRLTGIAERARANGVPGVRHLDRDELRAI